MTEKEKLVEALVCVRQSWVETTGASTVFGSASVAVEHGSILAIPATHWDISDQYFVEVTFYPRALETQPVKSLRAFIPKHEVVLIVELKSPEGMFALGYK